MFSLPYTNNLKDVMVTQGVTMGHKAGEIWESDHSMLIKLEKGHKRLHRYVMEQHIGRELLTEEIVHHIDGDIHNNDISNLQLMRQQEHASLHNTGRDLSKRKSRGPHSEETKRRIREGNLGKKRSEETRENIRKAKTGTKLSEEHKRNMSIAQKKRYEQGAEREKISKATTKAWKKRKNM